MVLGTTMMSAWVTARAYLPGRFVEGCHLGKIAKAHCTWQPPVQPVRLAPGLLRPRSAVPAKCTGNTLAKMLEAACTGMLGSSRTAQIAVCPLVKTVNNDLKVYAALAEVCGRWLSSVYCLPGAMSGWQRPALHDHDW